MSYNNAVTQLLEKGYDVIGCNVPNLTLLMKKNESADSMHIVGCLNAIHNSEVSSEQLDSIAFQLERKFLIGQMARTVDILFLIFSEDIERDKKFCEGKTKFWLMDILGKQIIVYENQPEDFYEIREDMESVIKQNYKTRIQSNKSKVNLKQLPFITIGLILINVLVHVILEKGGDTQEALYMLKHGAILSELVFNKGEYYRLFTSMFMHFGIAHLLNNMLALALMGTKLERMIGRLNFTFVYLISGLIGSLSSAIIHYNTQELTVSAGASGAIYGVLGAIMLLAVLSVRNNDKSVYLRIILVLLLMLDDSAESIDVAAHIGGFVSGLLLMAIIFFYNKYKRGKLKKVE